MKNNKSLIIISIVLLNILVIFMVGQSLLGKSSQQDKLLEEARSLAKKELCSRSIDKYNEALLVKDELDIRLEMVSVYEKGLSINEFTNTYDVFNSVVTMVDLYKDEPIAYEKAADLLIKYQQYDSCAKILMQARDLKVTSENIEKYRNQVRYKYMKYFAMYTDIMPSFNGMYTVATQDGYVFLNDEGSPDVKGTFISATSFSEGYAVVKQIQSDGKERLFILNKEGARQAYLEGIESSSGVGKAKDKNANDILLLSCKVGDKYKYYDIEGNAVFGEYAFAGRFRNNIAAVMEAEGKWRLIDGTGKPIVDTVFSDVVLNEFDECAPKGLIIAKTGDKYHIYDLKGKQVGDFACDDAKAFVDDYAAFKSGEKWGFVDATGKVIIEPQYEDAKSFSNAMGAVKRGVMWSFINAKNEIVIEEEFSDVSYLNDKGICFVKDVKGEYWSYLQMYYTGK